jgi:hypothetical protein
MTKQYFGSHGLANGLHVERSNQFKVTHALRSTHITARSYLEDVMTLKTEIFHNDIYL